MQRALGRAVWNHGSTGVKKKETRQDDRYIFRIGLVKNNNNNQNTMYKINDRCGWTPGDPGEVA